MSAAQMHPTAVQQPARSGSAVALAFIVLVAIAIVVFAVGQTGFSVGTPGEGAAPATRDQAVRDHRLGEMTTGQPSIVQRTPTDSRLRRAVPPALTPAQRAEQLEADNLQAAMRLQAAAAYYADLIESARQGEQQRAIALQVWANYLQQDAVPSTEGVPFRGR